MSDEEKNDFGFEGGEVKVVLDSTAWELEKPEVKLKFESPSGVVYLVHPLKREILWSNQSLMMKQRMKVHR